VPRDAPARHSCRENNTRAGKHMSMRRRDARAGKQAVQSTPDCDARAGCHATIRNPAKKGPKPRKKPRKAWKGLHPKATAAGPGASPAGANGRAGSQPCKSHWKGQEPAEPARILEGPGASPARHACHGAASEPAGPSTGGTASASARSVHSSAGLLWE
jgi:hypothetical protein